MWFVYVDIGAYGGVVVVVVRFVGEFQVLDAERGARRGVFDLGQYWVVGGAGCGDLVQLRSVHGLALQGAVQRVQPAPAFVDEDIVVVVVRFIDLEEALGVVFEVDQGVVVFYGEGEG